MKKTHLMLMTATLFLFSCNQTPSQPATDNKTQAEKDILAYYQQQKQDLNVPDGADFQVYDVATGLTYREGKGLSSFQAAQVQANNVVTLQDGSQLAVAPQQEGWQTQANGCDTGINYCPYTRIESKTGYRKIHGTLVLPSAVLPLNTREAAYNYFGFKNSSFPGSNVEVGFYTDSAEAGAWRTFIRYKGSAGEDYFMGKFSLDDGSGPSAISYGTSISWQVYAPADQQLVLRYTYGGIERIRTFKNIYGITASGTNQIVRRVSSLLTAQANVSTSGKWRGLTFSTPTSSFLATSTYAIHTPGGHGRVGGTFLNPYYDHDFTLMATTP